MPNQGGSYLREWLADGTDETIGDPLHRHPSQLWGLHPGKDITPYDNTDEEQRHSTALCMHWSAAVRAQQAGASHGGYVCGPVQRAEIRHTRS